MKTHILCSITFFFPENRGECEIMWRITLDPDRPRWQSKMAHALYMLDY